MNRLLLLHTNDIHGRVDGLARVATRVERMRSENDGPVVYVDAGDVEETTMRISNLTKGTAMHRLLSAAGCEAATVGNAAWRRYGPHVVAEHAAVAQYPLLAANLVPLPGAHPTAVIRAGGVQLGLIGLTAPFDELIAGVDFGVEVLRAADVAREHARRLRAEGAEVVIVLSHLGLDVPEASIDDRRLAAALQGRIDVIVGAHSHHLLPEGERVGDVLIAQAGCYAEHLGVIEFDGAVPRAHVLPVPDDTPPHPAVAAEAEAIEPEIAAYLDEVIGELPYGVGPQWIADVLRERMGGDVAIVTAGQILTGELRPGVLRRGELWEACDSSGNPGVVEMTGAQLLRVIERGRDAGFMASTAGALRGRPRGALHVSGIEPAEIERERTYRVAGTDWELEAYGGMVEREWGMAARYDFPTIVREAIEEHLRR